MMNRRETRQVGNQTAEKANLGNAMSCQIGNGRNGVKKKKAPKTLKLAWHFKMYLIVKNNSGCIISICTGTI